MRDSLRERADSLIEEYSHIRRELRWRTGDIQARFMAFVYCFQNKHFHAEHFNEAVKAIKRNVGVFSRYRSSMLLPIVSMLDARYDDVEKAFLSMLDCEKKMKDVGFKSGTYLTMAVFALLISCPSEDKMENQIQKAMDIYKRMKEKHFWLTTSDDYAIAVLLAAGDEDIDNLIYRIDDIYNGLIMHGFRKSNGLQMLSHLMSFGDGTSNENVERCARIREYLRENRIKIPSMYYGTIGFLALLGEESENAASQLIEMVQYFKASKVMKMYYKDFNILIASAFVYNDYAERFTKNSQLVETGVGLSVQAIIAAQTAALVAAASSSAAAASSSASN